MKKQKRQNFNLKKEYFKALKYLRESRKFILGIVIIFFVFTLVGFFVPAPEMVFNQIMKFIEEILAKTQGMSQFEMINFIFFNNLQSSFYGLVFGLFLGIFPILGAVSNGYILGFVASITVKQEGFLTLWRILPHGIFELPAVFISLGLGVKLGTFLFQKEKLKSFKEFFLDSLRVFLLIVIPLLIIAAIIEGSFIFLVG